MNKEEIEELKDFTIDITDIDELALGLEVCSKKSNMVIQEFANLIIELEQQNKKYKEVIDKLKDKTKENIKNAKYEITTLTIGDKAYYQYIEKMLDNYVDILKGVDND